jgi:uncharacterized Zn-binding protein involved in type VI secretion
MGKPAARLTDMHVCPMVTGLVPHVGGPIAGPGAPTVLIGGLPAAVVGDVCVCTGPPDTIVLGSMGVMIGGKPAARMGDLTAHGGNIVLGCFTVLIGEVGGAAPGAGAAAAAMAGAVHPSFPASAAVAGAVAGAASAMPPEVVGAEAMKPQNQTADRSWFQAQVKYDDGTPAADVAYTLTLPDGTERKGKTDANGMVREGGVPPGQCELGLDGLDRETWEHK